MPSLVLSRFRAGNAKGNKLEFYGVRSFAANDPHRDRLMVGDSLVDGVHGSGLCNDCLLFNTGMCPNAPAA
jgi:hypothetical protein